MYVCLVLTEVGISRSSLTSLSDAQNDHIIIFSIKGALEIFYKYKEHIAYK